MTAFARHTTKPTGLASAYLLADTGLQQLHGAA